MASGALEKALLLESGFSSSANLSSRELWSEGQALLKEPNVAPWLVLLNMGGGISGCEAGEGCSPSENTF